MKYFFLLLGAALAWGQLQTPPPPADPVVITIGEEKITKSQFEQIISTFPEQQRAQLQTGPARKKLAEQLADLETLAQEGRARKLDQEPRSCAGARSPTTPICAPTTPRTSRIGNR